MKQIIVTVCLFSALSMGNVLPNEQTAADESDLTVHFFVLMVPDSTVKSLRNKARQDDDGAETLTETGAYVGQIISGVLGGDVRPIFAGSTSFIGEPDVQQGVSTILANVAPSVNNILKQWFNRVQTALGITTTPLPGTLVANGTRVRPSNGVVLGQGQGAVQPGQNQNLTPQQLQQIQLQQQQQQHQPVQQVQYIDAGSNVLSGSNLHDITTTVEPLPHLKLKPNDEDNEEEIDKVQKVVKVF